MGMGRTVAMQQENATIRRSIAAALTIITMKIPQRGPSIMIAPASDRLRAPLGRAGTAAAVLALANLLSACASSQKVDRVHSSLYYQQASIQQLQHDIESIEQQRQEVLSRLDQLQRKSADHAGLIERNQRQLQQLGGAQQQLTRAVGAMRSSVAANRGAITSMSSVEQQRQAIIKAQRARWLEITEQADRKLADLDQPQMDANPGSTENAIDNGTP
jgi:outer membrane murein-binding lipoprotein Lpp